MIITTVYDSPCGQLKLGAIGDRLCMCDWNVDRRRRTIDLRLCKDFKTTMVAGDNETLQKAIEQLNEFFSRTREKFDMPLVLAGTDLRQLVWNQLQAIAYGETISYQEFAEKLGRPTSVRAIASAIGANPISIFIPCHRVIGKNGSLTGYAGGIEAKRTLLELERSI